MILFIYTPQSAHAGTTTADILKWDNNSQTSFLQTSISMFAVIASQIRPKTANCLDRWYFENKSLQEKRHNEILGIMTEYEGFDPHAVLMAYLENVCGRFERP